MTGAAAKPESTAAILAKYSDLPTKLHPLRQPLVDSCDISYTQWEAWLALHHGKLLVIAKAADTAPRGPKYAATDASRTAQRAHLERLAIIERYPGGTFIGPDHLVKLILSGAILDILDNEEAEDKRKKARARLIKTFSYLLAAFIVLGITWPYLWDQIIWITIMGPYEQAQFQPLQAEEERDLEDKSHFKECIKYCPEMVVIPAGKFNMGSPTEEKGHLEREGPLHPVKITRRFAVSKFDVTNADWDACVSVHGCPIVSNFVSREPNHPMTYITWDEARQYAAWLSKMTDRHYRLLTEAEWEYAARAGTTTAYFWGPNMEDNRANCRECGGASALVGTSPVNNFNPNPYGLYDMAGNVWQRLQDCWNDDYRGAPENGVEWSSGNCSIHVIRGGAWGGNAEDLRSAARIGDSVEHRADNRGFRVARELLPPR
jgi:formylglycine-generating enzyme required for sulfatase activity